MNRRVKLAANPFSFSLETKVPVADCLQNLESYPPRGITGPVWRRILFSVQTISVDKRTGSFCLMVSNPRFPLQGAKAIAGLQRVNDTTVINGRIRNLAWKYFSFASYVFLVPVCVIGVATARSLEVRILSAILPVLLLHLGYIYPTLMYRTMLIDAIEQRIHGAMPEPWEKEGAADSEYGGSTE